MKIERRLDLVTESALLTEGHQALPLNILKGIENGNPKSKRIS